MNWGRIADRICGPVDKVRERGFPMKLVLTIVGVLIALAGGVWFLQGIGVLPGSFMTGQTQWAINGGVAVVIGLGLIIFANHRRGG
jgi:hypothetical protein